MADTETAYLIAMAFTPDGSYRGWVPVDDLRDGEWCSVAIPHDHAEWKESCEEYHRRNFRFNPSTKAWHYFTCTRRYIEPVEHVVTWFATLPEWW